MADPQDYVSFEKALQELQLSEEQLKRLVSEGEIRAIRGEHNTMRFRKEEIDRLKQDTGKTIQYTEESSDTLTDDLLFDESDDLEVEDEGMATAQISSEDTFVGEDETGMTTAPLGKKEQKAPPPVTRAKRQAAATGGEGPSGGGGAGGTGIRRTTARSTRMLRHAEERRAGVGAGMVAILVLTAILGIYTWMFVNDIANNQLSAPTEGFANFAGEKFGGLEPK